MAEDLNARAQAIRCGRRDQVPPQTVTIFFFFFVLSRSLAEALLPTDEQGFIQLRSRYAAALALRTALLASRARTAYEAPSTPPSAAAAADIARRRRHSHGTLKKQLLTQTVLAMSAVPSAQNVAAVFNQSYATVLEAAAASEAVAAGAAGACTTAKGQRQQGQSLQSTYLVLQAAERHTSLFTMETKRTQSLI